VQKMFDPKWRWFYKRALRSLSLAPIGINRLLHSFRPTWGPKVRLNTDFWEFSKLCVPMACDSSKCPDWPGGEHPYIVTGRFSVTSVHHIKAYQSGWHIAFSPESLKNLIILP
jgi:hypothetical protein